MLKSLGTCWKDFQSGQLGFIQLLILLFSVTSMWALDDLFHFGWVSPFYLSQRRARQLCCHVWLRSIQCSTTRSCGLQYEGHQSCFHVMNVHVFRQSIFVNCLHSSWELLVEKYPLSRSTSNAISFLKPLVKLSSCAIALTFFSTPFALTACMLFTCLSN